MPMPTSPAAITDRPVIPPQFAVQRAGAKHRVLAVHTRRHGILEAVTVTTVPELAEAKLIVRELREAWSGGAGPFRPADTAGLAHLPEPVLLAISDALAGCPASDGGVGGPTVDRAIILDAAKTGWQFYRTKSTGTLTPRQAAWLEAELDMHGSLFGCRDIHGEFYVPSVAFDWLPDEVAGAGQPAEWWEALEDAHYDLAFDLQGGQMPAPATFGEAVALWTTLCQAENHLNDRIQDMDNGHTPDDIVVQAVLALPADDLDEEWDEVFDALFGPIAHDLGGDDDTVDDLDKFCALLPVERWHELLPGRPPRDPARLLTM